MLYFAIAFAWPISNAFIGALIIFNFHKADRTYMINMTSTCQNQLPSFIAHLGSLNLSPLNFRKVQLIFNNLSQVIKPKAIVISGDITKHNDADEWRLFDILKSSISKDIDLFLAAGNHDHSYQNKPLNKYLELIQPNEFYNYSGAINFSNLLTKITVFNPMTFPVPPYPLSMMTYPSHKNMIKLNTSLNQISANFSIVVSSYQIDKIKNYRFELSDVLKGSHLYLTGNPNALKFSMDTFNFVNEFIAPPLDIQNKFGILVKDNSVISYNIMNIKDDYLYVLSSPSQFQYTRRFFKIRIIVFDVHPLTLEAEIDGISFGRMKTSLITDLYRIYELNAEASKGKHTLFIDGDISIKTFFIVDGLESFENSTIDVFDNFHDTHNFANYINLKKSISLRQNGIEIFALYLTIALIFLYFYIGKVNQKNTIFLLFIIMSVIPVYFFYSDNNINIVWPWGYSLSLRFNTRYNSFFFFIMHSLLIIFPLIGLIYFCKSKRTKLERLIFIFPVIVGLFIYGLIIYANASFVSLLLSPFVIEAIILLNIILTIFNVNIKKD